MASNTQPKKHTYPSSLLQASRWDRIKDSWLASAKVWAAPPKAETDALVLFVVTLVEEVDSRIDSRNPTFDRVSTPGRAERLQSLIKMLEKPALCFFLLNHDELFSPLINSLNIHNAHSKTRPGLFGDEIMGFEKELLTIIACFGFCRHIFEFSESIYVTRWQPWLEFSLPNLKPFTADAYMSVKGHLTHLTLRSAQMLRELTTYLLKGSQGIRYIEELSIIHRIGLLLYIVRDADAYQELLEALQGLLSALCLTKKGMEVVIAAVGPKTRWRRSLCRVNFNHDAIEENWIKGKGLLHYAFEAGLTVDMPADGDEHARRVEDAGQAVFHDGTSTRIEEHNQVGDGTPPIAKVHTKVYGAVLCESLNMLVEAEALFKKVDDLGQELREAFRKANCENDRRTKRRKILKKMGRPMWKLAMLCTWEYGREAVYIVGRHSGSLDYVTRIARYIGYEFEGRYVRWFSEDYPHLHLSTRIVYVDMVTMGRAFEPLMAMHPNCDARFIPQLLLLSDIQDRLTDMEKQIHFLCIVIDKPRKLVDPEFVGHLETVINSMTICSMHSANYLKTLFMKCIEMNIKMPLPTLLSIALNEITKVAYLTAAVNPPPRNYAPGSSYGLKANKAPTYDNPLYQRDPTTQRDRAHRRRALMNKRTTTLRLVCSLTVLLRRTTKYLYGNTSAGFKGVMNLGESVHNASDDLLEGCTVTVKKPFNKWSDYFKTKISHLKENSLENMIGGGYATIAEDRFKQWTVGRVVFEALLNAYSISADKTILRNTSLVELVEEVCGTSIKSLLEFTLVKNKESEAILKPKYLGRNGAFYLLTHIVEDSICKHRVSPLENNAKLLREVMPSFFSAETSTPGDISISNSATKYWTAKVKLLGPILGKLLELWVGFRIPTGIKLLCSFSSIVDCTSLKLDIEGTQNMPMQISRIAEWMFENNTNIPNAVRKARKARASNLAATAARAKLRKDAIDNNVSIQQTIIPTASKTSILLQPVSSGSNNLRVGWKPRQPTPQQLQQRYPRLRALPQAPISVEQAASNVAPAITVTPASPGLPSEQSIFTPATPTTSATPSTSACLERDSSQLVTQTIPTNPRNLNSPDEGGKQLVTPAIPTAPRNFTPPRPRNAQPIAPRNSTPLMYNSKGYHPHQGIPTTSSVPANSSNPVTPSRPVKVSHRSIGVDQFQRAHEHREQFQNWTQEQKERLHNEKWAKADETDVWKFRDPSRA